ncbi:hypothetical protein I6M68_03365 [Acinetobacter pittii]|nr:hypothetical protein [Acinetobacter pittii]
MLENFGAESSSAYKTAFALQKGFVLASALLNAKGAVMAAWNDPSNTTIWGKMAAAAAVVVQTNDLMSAIQGVALSGFATGGYTGDMGRGDVAGVVHGQEYVLNAAATKRVGVDTLNAINSGQSFGSSGATVLEPIVNVYVMEGQTADVTRNDDGSLDVRIRQIAGEVAEQTMVASLNNPNSRINKSMKQNFNVAPKR